jgi:hypothetical protein
MVIARFTDASGSFTRRREDSMKRVVITGIGVVAPPGVGKERFWKHLESGRSLSRFDEEMASMGINS